MTSSLRSAGWPVAVTVKVVGSTLLAVPSKRPIQRPRNIRDGPAAERGTGCPPLHSSRQRGDEPARAVSSEPASAGGGVFQAGALARDVRRSSAATVALAVLSSLLSPSGHAGGCGVLVAHPISDPPTLSPRTRSVLPSELARAERAAVLSAREPHAAVRKRAPRV
ncbi:hypothetical protein HPB50_013984 [Hyalomma asiaticum]|uniref:Uncharacterized protein n=1 Tax=Hyalomma asiaticum TaxID=266040 RepID=A0ACB7S6F7_HYAAI|nr:hypothetical protein HPB50_013984 [Hyalomma asiaticum]